MSPSMQSKYLHLRRNLVQLKNHYGLTALKAGTEVEDMTFAEIALLRRLSKGVLPLFVKIGGPEARNDMRACARIGVDGLIAPMVESPFALEKFISSAQSSLSAADYKGMVRGINLETVTAFQHLDAILGHSAAGELQQITAARSDLSASMGRSAEDPAVIRACTQIVQQSRLQNLRTSVGGSIMPASAQAIMEEINPDWINTRHMVLRCQPATDAPCSTTELAEAIEQALHFEIQLYDLWSSQPGSRSALHYDRARILEKRLAPNTLIPS